MKQFLAILFVTLNAFAIPQLINYQGQLTSPTGTPLDTTVAMTFRLYPVPVGGALSWTESHPSVIVTDGLFNVLLGSVSTLPDQFAVDRWLGITVGNNTEMTPRQRISSVAHAYRVGTVDGASGGTISSDVVISGRINVGSGNTNTGSLAVVHGQNNKARGDYSVVCGGGGASVLDSNSASGENSAIAGGKQNQATGICSSIGGGLFNSASHFGTVAGGTYNTATNTGAAILGGNSNTASAQYASVGGGASNNATGTGSSVGGGINNIARGSYSVVAGGGGGVPTDSNSARADYSTISGGKSNDVPSLATYAVVSGGNNNSSMNEGSTVSGGIRNVAGDELVKYATVGGGVGNAVWIAGRLGTICGGDSNEVRGGWSFIGGGHKNGSGGALSVICGGDSNHTSGDYATIGGGRRNASDGQESTVIGGFSNSASGLRATVLGGQGNEASGSYSCALGNNSHAIHPGAFVWGDGWGTNLTSSANDQFSIRASGGLRFYTNNAHSSGVTMAAGGNSWVVVSDSTRKRDIRVLNTSDVLNQLASLPMKSWEYKSEMGGTEHIGPMAQDFWNAFHLGSDSLGIETIDADGVLFASVKELAKENSELKSRVADLESLMQQMIQLGMNKQ